MMPHSFLFGHLLEMVKVSMKYPRDVDQQPVPYLLLREHPHLTATGMLYMDVWPIGPPMVAVIHPDIMAQYTQTVSLPKAPIMQTEFGPFTNCDDLVNQEGKDWKTWRSIFNPGFSMNNIITLVPEFLEEIQVFKDWLVSAAKSGQVVAIDPQALRVTVDVIARAVL
jgi:cytochrome P450